MWNRPIVGCGKVLLAVLCVMLAACAHKSAQDDEPDAFRNVTTISVDPLVAMPATVQYFSAGQAWAGALGGVVGAAIASAVVSGDPIRYRLQQNHVDMGAILVEEMHKALASQNRFRLADQDADAVLHLTVTSYGFNSAGPFTSNMKVLLHVDSKVTDRKGKVLFEDSDGETNERDTHHSMDEYFGDVSLLLAAFHQVAAEVANNQNDSLLRSAGAAPPAVTTAAASNPVAATPAAATTQQ